MDKLDFSGPTRLDLRQEQITVHRVVIIHHVEAENVSMGFFRHHYWDHGL